MRAWPWRRSTALGTAIGGLGARALFGKLIETNGREALFYGYVAGGALMIAAAVVELLLGVASERKGLEDITLPLTAVEPGATRGQGIAKIEGNRELVSGNAGACNR